MVVDDKGSEQIMGKVLHKSSFYFYYVVSYFNLVKSSSVINFISIIQHSAGILHFLSCPILFAPDLR